MNTDMNDAFAAFLVEDVILTLGTVRGALGWLGDGDNCPAAARAEAFARISRQIAALEDRARDLWQDLQAPPLRAPEPQVEDQDNLFDLGPILPPPARRPIFRSRRALP